MWREGPSLPRLPQCPFSYRGLQRVWSSALFCRGSWRAAQHESGLRGCREICLDCLCLRLGRRAVRWGREREWSRQTSTPERVIAQGPDEDGTLEVLV